MCSRLVPVSERGHLCIYMQISALLAGVFFLTVFILCANQCELKAVVGAESKSFLDYVFMAEPYSREDLTWSELSSP